MTQKRKRYGRRTMPNPNTQNFMAELKKTAKSRTSNFEPQDTALKATEIKQQVQSFTLPKHDTTAERPPKRRLDLDAYEAGTILPPKRLLLSPPMDSRSPHRTHRVAYALHKPIQEQLQKGQRPQTESRSTKSVIAPLPTQPPAGNGRTFVTAPKGTDFKEAPCHKHGSLPPAQSRKETRISVSEYMYQHRISHTAMLSDTTDSPISRLSTELLDEILQHALPSRPNGRHVRPHYRKGMMNGGLWCTTLDDAGVSNRDNIELTAIQVSKTFYDIGSDIFYGRSHFYFSDPDVFTWWARRLRPGTFEKIKVLAIQIGTDWKISRAQGHSFSTRANALKEVNRPVLDDMCTEEKWYHAFAMQIQPHQRLRRLHIQFAGWRLVPTSAFGTRPANHEMTFPEDRHEIESWRNKLCFFLDQRIRGIGDVLVDCVRDYGEGMLDQHKDRLEQSMKWPRMISKSKIERSPPTLGRALAQVRRSRENGWEEYRY